MEVTSRLMRLLLVGIGEYFPPCCWLYPQTDPSFPLPRLPSLILFSFLFLELIVSEELPPITSSPTHLPPPPALLPFLNFPSLKPSFSTPGSTPFPAQTTANSPSETVSSPQHSLSTPKASPFGRATSAAWLGSLRVGEGVVHPLLVMSWARRLGS
jgi:hypothetical protein